MTEECLYVIKYENAYFKCLDTDIASKNSKASSRTIIANFSE
ncbi:MAG: hypothetical protein QXZ11_03240 [Thermoproteota archaeon]